MYFIKLLLFLTICVHAQEPIYAVMITGKNPFRVRFARRAIESFLAQSYSEKRLIIVNHGEESLGPFESDAITEIRVARETILGKMRNMALDFLPENAVWIQWDDDDWHHPKVMEEQFGYMTKKGADLCHLYRQIQYAFRLNAAWEAQQILYGTIMARSKKDVRYPEIAKSEDLLFFEVFRKKYKVIGWKNPPYYYLRFIHGHNTWNEEHFQLNQRMSDDWNISEESKSYLSSILPKYKS